MAQNKWIPKDVLSEIYHMADDPEIAQLYRTRSALARAIRQKLKADRKIVPSQATVEKKISKYRKHKPDDKDKPWSVLDIAKYPIPHEVLPTVLKAWAQARVQNNPLTIRQAFWIARLYSVFREAKLKDNIDFVLVLARSFNAEEWILEFLEPKGVHPDNPRDMRWRWSIDTDLFKLIAKKDDPLIEQLLSLEVEGEEEVGEWVKRKLWDKIQKSDATAKSEGGTK